jgi:hypothetical protein
MLRTMQRLVLTETSGQSPLLVRTHPRCPSLFLGHDDTIIKRDPELTAHVGYNAQKAIYPFRLSHPRSNTKSAHIKRYPLTHLVRNLPKHQTRYINGT